jgi:arabinoxylan arabinofuranohydrolase
MTGGDEMKKPAQRLFPNLILFACACIMIFSLCAHAANPIITSTYTADPSPHQWSDGKYYMYCSHDQDADVDWNMVDYHIFSSTDLVNWVDNGIAFKNTDSPFGTGALWAPDCIYRNGVYYLYFPQNSAIGVATSTSPTGPFTNAKKLYQTANSQYTYDPMIFVDDDNQAYLLVSSCMNPDGAFKPVLCKLGADMISITHDTILSTTGNFHEGPWMFKRNGMYYLTWGGGDCSYSTSTSLLGPYTSKGVICNQWRDSSGNLIAGAQQHPGIACFSGHWYFASAWGAPDNKRRRIFMEYLYFNADGTIKFITPDMQGVVAPGLPFYKVEAENYDTMSGVQPETCGDTNQGYDLGSIGNGGYAVYKNMNFASGANSFQARVASANNGGTIEIRLDSLSGTLAGTCAVPGTGGWQTWATKSCSVSGASGMHSVFLKFTGGSGYLLNLNWFTFVANTTQTVLPKVPALENAAGQRGRKASISLNAGAAAIEYPPSVQLYDVSGKRLFSQGKAAAAGKRAAGLYVSPCAR